MSLFAQLPPFLVQLCIFALNACTRVFGKQTHIMTTEHGTVIYRLWSGPEGIMCSLYPCRPPYLHTHLYSSIHHYNFPAHDSCLYPKLPRSPWANLWLPKNHCAFIHLYSFSEVISLNHEWTKHEPTLMQSVKNYAHVPAHTHTQTYH